MKTRLIILAGILSLVLTSCSNEGSEPPILIREFSYFLDLPDSLQYEIPYQIDSPYNEDGPYNIHDNFQIIKLNDQGTKIELKVLGYKYNHENGKIYSEELKIDELMGDIGFLGYCYKKRTNPIVNGIYMNDGIPSVQYFPLDTVERNWPNFPFRKYDKSFEDNGIKLHIFEKEGYVNMSIEVSPNEDSTQWREFSFTYGRSLGGYDYYALGGVVIYQVPKSEHKLKLRYGGKLYESEVGFSENGETKYLNPELEALLNSFVGREDLESIVIGDELHVYEKSDIVRQSELILIENADRVRRNVISTTISATRALGDNFNYMDTDALGFFGLFDDDRFEGKCIYGNYRDFNDIFTVYDMKDYELNDKITSISIAYNGTDPETCSVLTVWEDTDFNNGDDDRTKHRLSFIATKEKPRVSTIHLKLIPCVGSANSWNDRISSAMFYFGNTGNYWKEY